MTYNRDIHHRRSIRLQGYDYSQAGAYFVTLCAHERECLFGEIRDGEMRLNDFGRIVENAWHDLSNHYPNMQPDHCVIMPNHFHGIIAIDGVGAGLVGAGLVGAGLKPAPTTSDTSKLHGLPEMVRALKTFSARRINEIRNTPGIPVWQRNYYEHVIRNDADYTRIAEYVADNPRRWAEDRLHPDNFISVNGNVGGNNNICGDANGVGARRAVPLRNVTPGGRHA